MTVTIELYNPAEHLVEPVIGEPIMFFANGEWHEGCRTDDYLYRSDRTDEDFEPNEVWFWHVPIDVDKLAEKML